MNNESPYDKNLTFKSGHFLLRPVEESDAENLLRCYSDVAAVRLMNADNCTCDFHFQTLDEMTGMIRGWTSTHERRWGEHKGGACIRLSVIDTQTSKAVGTIELFDKTRDIGILRLDLCSDYETEDVILELLRLSVINFYNTFRVQHILFKAIPDATQRISALRAYGFVPAEHHAMKPHGDYYMHVRCQESFVS